MSNHHAGHPPPGGCIQTCNVTGFTPVQLTKLHTTIGQQERQHKYLPAPCKLPPYSRSPSGQNAGNNDTCRVRFFQASHSRREVLSRPASVSEMPPHQQISRNCLGDSTLRGPGGPSGPVIGSQITWLKLLSFCCYPCCRAVLLAGLAGVGATAVFLPKAAQAKDYKEALAR